jgi:glycosyltransferase involved in cell wall biosynthesis
MNPPGVSICICTHNGAGRIRPVLEALAQQTAPAGSFEIVVIDNAGTDDTASVVGAFLAEHFGAAGRVIPEPQPGLSFARRRAVAEARGAIVCFLDDDNVAAPDYVEQAMAAFERHPRAGVVGGKVAADWQNEPTPLAVAVRVRMGGVRAGGSGELLPAGTARAVPGGSGQVRRSGRSQRGGAHERR